MCLSHNKASLSKREEGKEEKERQKLLAEQVGLEKPRRTKFPGKQEKNF